MKIGIDISQVVYGTGVSRYTQELIENLLKLDSENQYVLFFSSLRQTLVNLSVKENQTVNKNLKIKIFKFPPTFLDLLWNKWHFLNIEKFIGRVDVFHSSDWTQPPAEAKKVTTVHDLSFLHYPASFPSKIIKVQQKRLEWVKKECNLIIADSEATKKDLVKLLGFKEKKIRVIYLGVKKEIQSQKRETAFKIQNFKKRYKLKNDYILNVGTLEPRKNLIRLIEAFTEVLKWCQKEKKEKEIKLVLAGKKGWLYEEIFKKVKELSLADKVIFLDYVTEETKIALLKNALVFVYPSLYEGFGLPVLEAMAAGCPVITSNVSSLPEVAGKAAILVNPYKTEEISLALIKLLGSPKLRQQLTNKGKNQALKFSWEKTAKATLAVYQELIREKI